MRGSSTHALTRRDLAKVAASAPLAALLAQTDRVRAQELPDVPRERQLILCGGGVGGSFELRGIWNPIARTGAYVPAMWLVNEPLASYSGFTDMTLLTLAEHWGFSDDSLGLQIGIRTGISWSDGEPFGAEDVAFTINSIRDLGPTVRMGEHLAPFVDEAVATSETEVLVAFKEPAPRFMFLARYKGDTGLPILPRHIFEGQDLATFANFDPDAGLPLTTGPWQVTLATPGQIVLDRRDDWWAVEQGIASAMPEVERIVFLPFVSEDDAAQALTDGQIDSASGLGPLTVSFLASANHNVSTSTRDDSPYGLLDWAPVLLYVKCAREPFSDPAVRQALSHFLDRQESLERCLGGAGNVTSLPIPSLPTLAATIEATSDLLAQYPVAAFDPDEGGSLLTEAGWSKEGDAWSKDGQALTIEIEGNEEFADLSLILAEQLLRQGIGATFSVAFDLPERMAAGEYGAALGRLRGSISADPYYALVPFQTESATPKAGLQPNLSHWRNDAFDAVVDELAVQPVDHFPALDPDVLIGLWQEAMATWLPELPSIPLLETSECAPWSTGQWTGWPTASDPYAGASFAQATFQQVLNQLRPVR